VPIYDSDPTSFILLDFLPKDELALTFDAFAHDRQVLPAGKKVLYLFQFTQFRRIIPRLFHVTQVNIKTNP
jgi:hypothetical protein